MVLYTDCLMRVNDTRLITRTIASSTLEVDANFEMITYGSKRDITLLLLTNETSEIPNGRKQFTELVTVDNEITDYDELVEIMRPVLVRHDCVLYIDDYKTC